MRKDTDPVQGFENMVCKCMVVKTKQNKKSLDDI